MDTLKDILAAAAMFWFVTGLGMWFGIFAS
jgi:hypothetical protein